MKKNIVQASVFFQKGRYIGWISIIAFLFTACVNRSVTLDQERLGGSASVIVVPLPSDQDMRVEFIQFSLWTGYAIAGFPLVVVTSAMDLLAEKRARRRYAAYITAINEQIETNGLPPISFMLADQTVARVRQNPSVQATIKSPRIVVEHDDELSVVDRSDVLLTLDVQYALTGERRNLRVIGSQQSFSGCQLVDPKTCSNQGPSRQFVVFSSQRDVTLLTLDESDIASTISQYREIAAYHSELEPDRRKDIEKQLKSDIKLAKRKGLLSPSQTLLKVWSYAVLQAELASAVDVMTAMLLHDWSLQERFTRAETLTHTIRIPDGEGILHSLPAVKLFELDTHDVFYNYRDTYYAIPRATDSDDSNNES